MRELLVASILVIAVVAGCIGGSEETSPQTTPTTTLESVTPDDGAQSFSELDSLMLGDGDSVEIGEMI